MSRKFIRTKEIAFFKEVNKELIQSVIGQEVIYWAISLEKTRLNELYSESIDKVYTSPVKTNALVYYENTTESVGNMPPDAKFNIDVYFHNGELDDRNLKPKMGDFVQFGEVIYEITSVTQPQLFGGMIDQKVMTRCPCVPARKGQFSPPKKPMPVLGQDPNAPAYKPKK